MFHLLWIARLLRLILCLLAFVAAPASADEYMPAAACADVFKITNTLPEQRVVLVPSQLHERVPATVCVLDSVYVTHVGVTREQQHLTVTLYDNGFSWSPNPLLIVSGDLPPLSAGTYTMDVVVAADFAYDGPYYPYPIAKNIPIVVAGSVQLAALPMLDRFGFLAVILTLVSVALLRLRVANALRK